PPGVTNARASVGSTARRSPTEPSRRSSAARTASGSALRSIRSGSSVASTRSTPRVCTRPRTLDVVTRLRVALCQINTTVGDLEGNVERILAALADAEAQGCDMAVLPELAITGYPPEDLLLKPGFVADNREALDRGGAARRRRAGGF